jgi:hypothetical protein
LPQNGNDGLHPKDPLDFKYDDSAKTQPEISPAPGRWRVYSRAYAWTGSRVYAH